MAPSLFVCLTVRPIVNLFACLLLFQAGVCFLLLSIQKYANLYLVGVSFRQSAWTSFSAYNLATSSIYVTSYSFAFACSCLFVCLFCT